MSRKMKEITRIQAIVPYTLQEALNAMHSKTLKAYITLRLIKSAGWASSRLRLKWNLRVTKTYRYYMQLSTINSHPIEALYLLPTPTSRDYKGARTTEALKKAGRNHSNSLPDAFARSGRSVQLNSPFVQEMMGYPAGWLYQPFFKNV